MDNYELNYHIVCELPQRVRDILAVIDYMNTDLISQALGRLDSTHKEQAESKSGFPNNKANAPVRREVGVQPYQRPSINHVRREAQPIRSAERSNSRSNFGGEYDNRSNTESSNERFVLPDLSRPPPKSTNNFYNHYNDTNNQDLNQVNNIANDEIRNTVHNNGEIRALRRSEFICDLCWDVESNSGPPNAIVNSRIISPRIQTKINYNKVNILVDSGSEVTCISDELFRRLNQGNKFLNYR